jgi:hypothetical protein
MDATPEGETAEGKAFEPTPVPQEPAEEHLSSTPAAAIEEAADVETTIGDALSDVIPAPEGSTSQDGLEERLSPAPVTEVGEASGT